MSTNIAVVSKDYVPAFRSKYTLFQSQIPFENPQQYLNAIVKYTSDNKCVGYIEVGNHKYEEDFIDVLLDGHIDDINISFVYCDYSLNGIPYFLNSNPANNIPLFFIRLEHLIKFGNLQNMLQNTITKHIPVILLNA